MNIETLLPFEHIVLGLEATTKEEVVRQLAKILVAEGIVQSENEYVQSVMEREDHSTTGIGNNIAIPHGKSRAVSEPAIVFARLKAPLEWQSLDDEPVTVVIMLAIPEEHQGDTHLRILSEIAMKLMDEDITEALKSETDKEIIAKLLSE